MTRRLSSSILSYENIKSCTDVDALADDWISYLQSHCKEAAYEFFDQVFIKFSSSETVVPYDLFAKGQIAVVLDRVLKDHSAHQQRRRSSSSSSNNNNNSSNNNNNNRFDNRLYCDKTAVFFETLIKRHWEYLFKCIPFTDGLVKPAVLLSNTDAADYRYVCTLFCLKLVTGLLSSSNRLKNTVRSLLTEVFAKRIRDSFGRIRRLCLEELSVWIEIQPSKFGLLNYLRHFVDALYDRADELGICSLNAVKKLLNLRKTGTRWSTLLIKTVVPPLIQTTLIRAECCDHHLVDASVVIAFEILNVVCDYFRNDDEIASLIDSVTYDELSQFMFTSSNDEYRRLAVKFLKRVLMSSTNDNSKQLTNIVRFLSRCSDDVDDRIELFVRLTVDELNALIDYETIIRTVLKPDVDNRSSTTLLRVLTFSVRLKRTTIVDSSTGPVFPVSLTNSLKALLDCPKFVGEISAYRRLCDIIDAFGMRHLDDGTIEFVTNKMISFLGERLNDDDRLLLIDRVCRLLADYAIINSGIDERLNEFANEIVGRFIDSDLTLDVSNDFVLRLRELACLAKYRNIVTDETIPLFDYLGDVSDSSDSVYVGMAKTYLIVLHNYRLNRRTTVDDDDRLGEFVTYVCRYMTVNTNELLFGCACSLYAKYAPIDRRLFDNGNTDRYPQFVLRFLNKPDVTRIDKRNVVRNFVQLITTAGMPADQLKPLFFNYLSYRDHLNESLSAFLDDHRVDNDHLYRMLYDVILSSFKCVYRNVRSTGVEDVLKLYEKVCELTFRLCDLLRPFKYAKSGVISSIHVAGLEWWSLQCRARSPFLFVLAHFSFIVQQADRRNLIERMKSVLENHQLEDDSGVAIYMKALGRQIDGRMPMWPLKYDQLWGVQLPVDQSTRPTRRRKKRNEH